MNEQEEKELRPDGSGADGAGDEVAVHNEAPTDGDRIVAQIGRLAALRDGGALSDEALAEATAEVEGKVAFTSDGNGGLVIQFGMMPDMCEFRPGREEELAALAARRYIREQRRKNAGLPPEPTEE